MRVRCCTLAPYFCSEKLRGLVVGTVPAQGSPSSTPSHSPERADRAQERRLRGRRQTRGGADGPYHRHRGHRHRRAKICVPGTSLAGRRRVPRVAVSTPASTRDVAPGRLHVKGRRLRWAQGSREAAERAVPYQAGLEAELGPSHPGPARSDGFDGPLAAELGLGSGSSPEELEAAAGGGEGRVEEDGSTVPEAEAATETGAAPEEGDNVPHLGLDWR
ncbi:unnamed protein product [Ectocarpus sp. 13 AM-2016]